MKDLIGALTILARYVDDDYPTCCEHDELFVKGPEPDVLTEHERKRLDELSFKWRQSSQMWSSFRFGSC